MRTLPPGFAFRTIAVAPGCRRVYDEAEWRDALVVVEHGEIELECLSGRRRRFARGDLLWLSGLPLRALHNSGREPALLAAISRQRQTEVQAMTDHKVGTREEWLAASRELLAEEKELTRRSDGLARRRRELPWVRIEKEYRFETTEGTKTLAELFDGRSQLLVYHFMFGPDWTEGCDGCSLLADHFDGPLVHLNQRDVTLVCVSRAPLEKLQAYKRRMAWTFPWVSSLGSDFNFDFGVSFTEEQRRNGGEYNFRRVEGGGLGEEEPGMSAFALEDGVVYHTYSFFARGGDALMTVYQLLDRAPNGRDEDDLDFPQEWWRRRDEYEEAAAT
jgi:predicted dithiol-disulfide oxidoreductase (DUF899 family)